jgi:electron transport complex protein RnfG
MARLTLVLFGITVVVSLLLGLVNYITEDRIKEINEEKTASAMREVLPADSYTEVAYNGSDATVVAVFEAGKEGYVVKVMPSGFGGAIDMGVGVDSSGAVTGVSIIKMSETSGLGTNATKPEFKDQYTGGTGDFAVNKDGGEIDALTGATITSRAVTRGVNSAVDAVKALG